MKVIFKIKKKIIPCLFSCIFIPFSLFHFTKVEDKVSFNHTTRIYSCLFWFLCHKMLCLCLIDVQVNESFESPNGLPLYGCYSITKKNIWLPFRLWYVWCSCKYKWFLISLPFNGGPTATILYQLKYVVVVLPCKRFYFSSYCKRLRPVWQP